MAELVVRPMMSEEQPLLWEMAKTTDLERDWLAIWTRFKNWEKYPPLLTVVDGDIAGLHLYTTTKTYWYTYFFWVAEQYRGLGISHESIECAIERMISMGLSRWKLKCHIDNGRGLGFWDSFGMEVIGHSDKEFYYDVVVLPDGEFDNIATQDGRTLAAYRKCGVVYTHPNWRHLNG